MPLSTKVDFIKDRFDPFSEVFSPASIDDEQKTIPAASPFYVRTKEVVKQDSPSSIEIWTGAGKTGTEFTEVSGTPGANQFQVDYKFQSGYIRFNEANANLLIYISYKGLGDVIQAVHMNTVQNVLNLDNIPLTAVGLAIDSVETLKIKDLNVTGDKIANLNVAAGKIKTSVGSSSGNVAGNARVFITMNDYCFFPNIYLSEIGTLAAFNTNTADYIGRFAIWNEWASAANYYVRWRYIAAS